MKLRLRHLFLIQLAVAIALVVSFHPRVRLSGLAIIWNGRDGYPAWYVGWPAFPVTVADQTTPTQK